jgi:hypothetical protein
MTPKAYELVHLRPEQVHFQRRGDTLSLTLSEQAGMTNSGGDSQGVVPGIQHYPRVVLRCCFPVSEESLYLSVRDATTEEQEEIGLIDDWTALAPSDREAVAAELGLLYFVPQIKQVLRVKEEFGFLYWTVETDKGPKEFIMRNSVVHYAREVGPEHWLLIDVNQARYEIPDVSALDAHSQKLVRRFLYL